MRTAIAAATFLACCGLAAAHPLGNFTTNRYAALTVEPRAVRIAYALDLAELPAYREIQLVDSDGDGAIDAAERDAYTARKSAELAQHLELTEDGEQLALDARRDRARDGSGRGRPPDAPPGRHVPRRASPSRRRARVPRSQLRRPPGLAGGRRHAGRRRAPQRCDRAGQRRQPRAARISRGHAPGAAARVRGESAARRRGAPSRARPARRLPARAAGPSASATDSPRCSRIPRRSARGRSSRPCSWRRCWAPSTPSRRGTARPSWAPTSSAREEPRGTRCSSAWSSRSPTRSASTCSGSERSRRRRGWCRSACIRGSACSPGSWSWASERRW